MIRIGFEFEFFTNALSDEETAKSLSKDLEKKIRKPGKDYDNFSPSENEFKLMTDTSGGPKMRELVTGPLEYEEARSILLKILSWITSNGYTTDKCSLHINISEDNFEFRNIKEANIRLNIDEDKIYELFPNRKDNVYCRSVKNLMPLNFYFIQKIYNPNAFSFCNLPSKYFGVNFIKMAKGYLEFRYIGGKGYEKNIVNVIEVLNVYLKAIKDSKKELNDSKKSILIKYVNDTLKKIEIFKNVENLLEVSEEFEFSVDLRIDYQMMATFLSTKKQKLIELYLSLKPKEKTKIRINYDSDSSVFQIYKFEGIVSEFESLEFIECKIESSTIPNCDFYDCEIKNSILTKCNLFSGSKASSNKLEDCYINSEASCKDCYIDGVATIFNGKGVDNIIRKGRIGELANLNDSNIVMDVVKIPAGFFTVGNKIIIDTKNVQIIT